jgi:trimeric autotransporter adhesin
MSSPQQPVVVGNDDTTTTNQQQQQNHHPIIHNPDSDIESRLQYLREHRICERLELMVRELIAQRPDEPVLALCAFLKEADRTLGIKTSSSSSSNLGTNNNISNITNQQQQHLSTSARGGGGTTTSTKQNLSSQQQQQSAATAATSTGGSGVPQPSSTTGMLQRNAFGSQSSLRSAATSVATSQPNSPHLGNTLNGSSTNLPIGRNVAVATQAGNLPPLAVRTNNNNSNSNAADGTNTNNNNNNASLLQQQQAAVHTGRTSVTSGRVTSAAANTGRGGTATATSINNNNNPNTFLERDESARSDLSMYSIQSVDMGEFLSEFRAAHHALFGGTKHRISFQDLADIVDRVAVPLPDTSMLAALFMEMESASSHSGLVVFEGFLSRMAQRIQGRFSGENLAGLFLQLASMHKGFNSNSNNNAFFFSNNNNNSNKVGGTLSSSSNIIINNSTNIDQQQQGSTTAASSATSSAQVSRAGSPGIIVTTSSSNTKNENNNNNNNANATATATTTSMMDAMILNAQSLTRPSSSAASTDAALVAHTTWVPAKFCVEEGLESLGIRLEDIPPSLVSQISAFLQAQISSSSTTPATTTTTTGTGTGTGTTTMTTQTTSTNLTSPLLPSPHQQQQQQQQQHWSIQDFVRIANSIVGGPAPLTSHSLYQHTTNHNSSASGLRGGSMSNIASVQDLAYE